MRVYLASRFSMQQEHLPRIKDLEEVGMKCCSRWITEEPTLSNEDDPEIDRLRREWAYNDYCDVVDADFVVFWAEGPENVPGRARGGRHVEYGIALALDIPIVVVGPKENIFHWIDGITHVETWEQALTFLKEE